MNRAVWRRRVALCAGLALVFVSLGGCGSSTASVSRPPFEIKGIGPEGGSIAAGDVALVIPPGALPEPTSVSILPQTDPLPLVPIDFCNYSFLGPLWCCGPVGTPLLVGGNVQVDYDPGLMPPGVTLDDLVLLEWNNAIGAFQANLSATHDQVAHIFTDANYQELGHIAVGIRLCPQRTVPGVEPGELAYLGVDSEGNGTTIPEGSPAGLYVVNADDLTTPADFLTTSVFPGPFIPSPDGMRVLYEYQDFDTSGQGRLELHAIGADDTGDGLLEDEGVIEGDPLVGWLAEGAGDRVFYTQIRLDEDGTAQPTELSVNLVPGDGSAAGAPYHGIPDTGSFVDLRQASDGLHFLVVYDDFEDEDRVVEVVRNGTPPTVVSSNIPFGGGQQTPRFTPDGTGVYLVNGAQDQVVRYDLDGTDPTTLYEIPVDRVQLDALQDAVLSPDGDTLAWIVRESNEQDILRIGPNDGSDTTLAEYPFFTTFDYGDMLFHPNGEVLYVDLGQFVASGGVIAFQVDPDAAPAARLTRPGPDLPVSSLRQMDINAVDGRLLITVFSISRQIPGDELGKPVQGGAVRFETIGLYVAEPLGTNERLITTPDDLFIQGARWLQTIRRAAGFRRAGVR